MSLKLMVRRSRTPYSSRSRGVVAMLDGAQQVHAASVAARSSGDALWHEAMDTMWRETVTILRRVTARVVRHDARVRRASSMHRQRARTAERTVRRYNADLRCGRLLSLHLYARRRRFLDADSAAQ